jgi:hypothetical protein
LLTTTATESGATINEPRKVIFTGADKTINSVPEARRLPCYVLLENGSVFIYGGLASNGDVLKDAWILNVAAGTWLKAPLVSPGRAGGSCEKIGPSQVMVVGGKLEWKVQEGYVGERKDLNRKSEEKRRKGGEGRMTESLR